jgi:MFS family permease
VRSAAPESRVPSPRSLAAWIVRIAGPVTHRRLTGLRWLFIDALIGSASSSFYEEFVVLFALALGATPDRIGVLSGVANLFGVAAYLPGAYLLRFFRSRKPFVLATSAGLARLAILAMAFVPFLARGPGAAFALVLALRCVTVFMGSAGTPAATSINADLVPVEARGRFFAGRNAGMGIVALVAAPLAGLLANWLNGRQWNGFAGYQALFAIAFAFGALGWFTFSRIPEPPNRRGPRPPAGVRHLLGLLGRNRSFAWFVASALVWSLFYSLAGPFYNVYLIEGLGGTAVNVGANTGIYAAGALAGQLVFGALVDRRGNRPLFVLTGLLVPMLPVLWAFVRVPEQIYPINVASGFLWAGYNLAAFNLLLETSPSDDREAGVALHNTVVTAGAVAGPLLGGVLVGALGYVPVFLISGAGRLAATLLFVAFSRDRQPRWTGRR